MTRWIATVKDDFPGKTDLDWIEGYESRLARMMDDSMGFTLLWDNEKDAKAWVEKFNRRDGHLELGVEQIELFLR